MHANMLGCVLVQRQRFLAGRFPDRSFHGIVNKYALELNRARGRRDDPCPQLSALRQQAMMLHLDSPALLPDDKFGVMITHLRGLLDGHAMHTGHCHAAVRTVVSQVQQAMDDIQAGLALCPR